MSVRYYPRSRPHPGGFIGFRVAVMIKKNHKQRYLSTKIEGDYQSQFKLAHKLNARWLAEKEKYSSWLKNQAIPTSRSKYCTGVRGIALKYVYSPDKKGNTKAYKHRRYVVMCSHNGKIFSRCFHVTKQGWHDAVKYLAKSKELTRWQHLLARQDP